MAWWQLGGAWPQDDPDAERLGVTQRYLPRLVKQLGIRRDE
jgi:hypothetical protein